MVIPFKSTFRLRAAGTVLGVLALSAFLPAGASASTSVVKPAVSCYGGGVAVSLPANGYSTTFTTSSRCTDINLKISSGGAQSVAVCWASTDTCQPAWTLVPQDGNFHVVASGVKDGVSFTFVTTGGGGTRLGVEAS